MAVVHCIVQSHSKARVLLNCTIFAMVATVVVVVCPDSISGWVYSKRTWAELFSTAAPSSSLRQLVLTEIGPESQIFVVK